MLILAVTVGSIVLLSLVFDVRKLCVFGSSS
jgi:hypothetical protein